jgi:hypothetical protein
MEALSIAYHSAVIVLDSSGDSAHRPGLHQAVCAVNISEGMVFYLAA